MNNISQKMTNAGILFAMIIFLLVHSVNFLYAQDRSYMVNQKEIKIQQSKSDISNIEDIVNSENNSQFKNDSNITKSLEGNSNIMKLEKSSYDTDVTILPGQSKNFSHQIYSDATTYSYSASTPFFITFKDLGASSFMGWVTIKYKLSVSILAPGGTYPVTVKYTLSDSWFPYTYNYNVTTGSTNPVEDENTNVPLKFSLNQNYPNPFNPTTTISYSLPKTNQVLLRIFDINGKLVKVLVDEEQSPGIHYVKWDGTTESATPASAGLYFYKIKIEKHLETKKMLLFK